ncbi:hypothetical protein AMATHDRAFT_153473 [Amanita thiersii Skay4041]|uniref:TRAM domain-containing protein n=1 Tax=Amanita thiersii Skay4041 TaxID=703135 RepID=A0A2A9N8V0_9AGAR|nr:hypothetical protein AMATHDRAFT_153473 [Amanita thiersii Skay4041]
MPAERPSKVIGEVRAHSDSDSELPVVKKPRLDTEKGSNPVISENTSQKAKTRKVRKKDLALPEPCSPEDVLWQDIISVLGNDVYEKAKQDELLFTSPFQRHEIVPVEIASLSATGEAIGLVTGQARRPWAIIVPFALPGEIVQAKIFRDAKLHSYAELVEVTQPNLELRDMSEVKCKYFGTCGGCQYQMLPYDKQLKIKRDVVVKAFDTFSGLPVSSIPAIQPTVGAPLQYHYRTKLTPHFDGPPKEHRYKKAVTADGRLEKPDWLKIGFNRVGTRSVIDIEECPIATQVVNETLPKLRENIIRHVYPTWSARSAHTYKKGVSLVLRDSLLTDVPPPVPPSDSSDSINNSPPSLDEHFCITDPKANVREKVGDWIFEYNASSFFQNNNSALVPLIDHIRDAIFLPQSTPDTTLRRPTHLVDAYCGAGLFSISLSPYFDVITGIEISDKSIKCAKKNALMNGIPSSKISFREGDAADIFSTVRRNFPPDKTVLIIDPPRKGCDDQFIKQLLNFRCSTIVYVSCFVPTQARDVGKLIQATRDDGEGRRYVLESVRGFDLFPQTSHVEGVAILRLV